MGIVVALRVIVMTVLYNLGTLHGIRNAGLGLGAKESAGSQASVVLVLVRILVLCWSYCLAWHLACSDYRCWESRTISQA